MKTTSQQIVEQDKQYYLPVFGRFPLAIKEGKGSKLYDWDGNEYIDVLSGIAVNNLGYGHPEILKTIQEQSAQLIHISNFFATKPQADLARKLVVLSGLDHAFFANSGAEAMEGAFKLGRKYAHSMGRGGTILSFEGCFHGRTLATIASGKEMMQKGFEPIPSGFKKAILNDIESVKKQVDKEVGVIVVEPIQGEGGINVADVLFLKELRQLCDTENIALIFDEIQCGMGRTGTMFAYEQLGVKPDIMALAKGLGAGFPVGAVLSTKKVSGAIAFGDHGTTFGGNPLASAVALCATGEIEKLLPYVNDLSAWFFNELQIFAATNDIVTGIRGKGLMIGIELGIEGLPVVKKMLAKGVIANCTAGNVIRFLPPLNITKKDLKQAFETFKESLEEVVNE